MADGPVLTAATVYTALIVPLIAIFGMGSRVRTSRGAAAEFAAIALSFAAVGAMIAVATAVAALVGASWPREIDEVLDGAMVLMFYAAPVGFLFWLLSAIRAGQWRWSDSAIAPGALLTALLHIDDLMA